ncbi:Nucleolar complex protein 3 [Dermatophagoides pteronyssinus]|uniref:Nucleolar complex protein 3 n=1 Tax=Dermatophagoides pteronyssinus TaxID=6956 RepID=A0ABQ8JTC2_DERPT|nr:Nucleolar complex protein 3 [Dermatophagoides pteronyssinus]
MLIMKPQKLTSEMVYEDENDFEMMAEDDDNDDANRKSSVTGKKPIKKATATLVEKFAERHKTIQEYRKFLSNISERVMSDPQYNINRIKPLLDILITTRDDPRIGSAFFSIQKLTFITLNVIFLDIIPNYRIYKRGEQTSLKLKDETRHVLDFENRLLQYYQEYLKRLKRSIGSVIDSKKQGDSDFYRTMLTTVEARQRLATIGCRCLSELINRHYDFNCRETLVDLAAKILCSNQATNEMQQIIYDGLKNLFRKDLLGETTVVFVKLLTKMIQDLRYRIRPITMSVFANILYRKIRDQDSKTIEKNGKSNNQQSKRDRKQAKKMKQLEKQLLETEATENDEIRQRHELNIHEILYAFFMKFITIIQESSLSKSNHNCKDFDRWYRPLLSISLESINHLALYSNEEFSYAWIKKLKLFIEKSELIEKFQPYDKLILMKNIYTLMSRIENKTTTTNQFDFKHLYQFLYEFPIDQIIDGQQQQQQQTFSMYIQCIHAMIIKSIRQHFPLNRLMNFVCRFLSLATNPMDSQQKSIQTIRIIINSLMNKSNNGYIQLLASCLNELIQHKNRHYFNQQQQYSLMNKFIRKYHLNNNICELLLSDNINESFDLFIRIPRCNNGGYCSINRLQQNINNDEWNQSECRPTNIQYKTIIQTIKSYDQYKIQKSLEYRKIQIAYHTGCQCYCRQQQQQCENNRKQFFNDSCQCECRLDLADEQFDCSKRFTRHGHMFWDNNRCECRCPQFYYEYIHHLNPLLSMNNQYYCPNGHYLDQNNTTFQQSNQRSITKGKYHQHPQTAKNFLNEFARFYNVGIVYSDGDFNNQQENLSKYHLKIGKNDSIPDSETIKKSKIQRIKRTANIQPQAECLPELQTIQLITTAVGNNHDLYYPHCIRLPRCSGCCPSQRLICRPKSIINRNISIIHIKYSNEQRKYRFNSIKNISIEYHQKCGCECIQKSNDCQYGQIYLENECRCVCSLNDRLKCLHFNYVSCRCEQIDIRKLKKSNSINSYSNSTLSSSSSSSASKLSLLSTWINRSITNHHNNRRSNVQKQQQQQQLFTFNQNNRFHRLFYHHHHHHQNNNHIDSLESLKMNRQ